MGRWYEKSYTKRNEEHTKNIEKLLSTSKLSEWEINFLKSLKNSKNISDKQMRKLNTLITGHLS